MRLRLDQWRRAASQLWESRSAGNATEELVAECLQCGSDRVDVLEFTRRRARLSCRACRAVMTTHNLRLVRTGPLKSAPKDQTDHRRQMASDPLEPLLPYTSSLLRAWLRPSLRPSTKVRLDKGSIYRIWKEFDRFLASTREDSGAAETYGELAAQAGAPPQPPSAPLPSFREIVGQLHDHCYDDDAVVAALRSRVADDAAWSAALGERVACAQRWLAGPGRQLCWIESRSEIDPDSNVVRQLLDFDFDRRLDHDEFRSVYAALFGTDGGPPIHLLAGVFGVEQLRDALATHLRDGSHPLREHVLHTLGRVDSP